jgi:hypothetical protein
MEMAELLRKHLSPKDFERMQAFIASMPEPQRAELMQFMAEREEKAPGVGDDAPDFQLPLLGNPARTVTLSSFRGRKPVALIFGSFT